MTGRILMSDIQTAVCKVFDLRADELGSDSKIRRIARPRQVGMYVARALTSHSLPVIGRSFGKDHSTVLHSVRNIDRLYGADPILAAQAERVRRFAEACASSSNTGAR